MHEHTLRASTGAPWLIPLLVGACLGASSGALAAAADGTQWPQQAPYAIGHTTVVIIDTVAQSGWLDPGHFGGPAAVSASVVSDCPFEATQHVRYTWNNPIYNQNPGGAVYPGLPDTPALTFAGSISAHPIAEGCAARPGPASPVGS